MPQPQLCLHACMEHQLFVLLLLLAVALNGRLVDSRLY